MKKFCKKLLAASIFEWLNISYSLTLKLSKTNRIVLGLFFGIIPLSCQVPVEDVEQITSSLTIQTGQDLESLPSINISPLGNQPVSNTINAQDMYQIVVSNLDDKVVAEYNGYRFTAVSPLASDYWALFLGYYVRIFEYNIPKDISLDFQKSYGFTISESYESNHHNDLISNITLEGSKQSYAVFYFVDWVTSLAQMRNYLSETEFFQFVLDLRLSPNPMDVWVKIMNKKNLRDKFHPAFVGIAQDFDPTDTNISNLDFSLHRNPNFFVDGQVSTSGLLALWNQENSWNVATPVGLIDSNSNDKYSISVVSINSIDNILLEEKTINVPYFRRLSNGKLIWPFGLMQLDLLLPDFTKISNSGSSLYVQNLKWQAGGKSEYSNKWQCIKDLRGIFPILFNINPVSTSQVVDNLGITYGAFDDFKLDENMYEVCGRSDWHYLDYSGAKVLKDIPGSVAPALNNYGTPLWITDEQNSHKLYTLDKATGLMDSSLKEGKLILSRPKLNAGPTNFKVDFLAGSPNMQSGNSPTILENTSPATSALFNQPKALHAHGKYLFIADFNNNLVRRMNLETNQIENFAGTGFGGNMFNTSNLEVSPQELNIEKPVALTSDSNYLYIISNYGVISKVNLDGSPQKVSETIFAGARYSHIDGSADGKPNTFGLVDYASIKLNFPEQMVVHKGYLYVADRLNYAVRKISLAINNKGQRQVQNIISEDFRFEPVGVAFLDGDLYISEITYAKLFRVINPTNQNADYIMIEYIAGTKRETNPQVGIGHWASFARPGYLASDDNFLYLLDNNAGALRVIDHNGFINIANLDFSAMPISLNTKLDAPFAFAYSAYLKSLVIGELNSHILLKLTY